MLLIVKNLSHVQFFNDWRNIGSFFLVGKFPKGVPEVLFSTYRVRQKSVKGKIRLAIIEKHHNTARTSGKC